jgi:hypothetical protein
MPPVMELEDVQVVVGGYYDTESYRIPDSMKCSAQSRMLSAPNAMLFA